MARSASFMLALAAASVLLIAGVAAQVDIRSSSCPNLIQRGQTGTCVTSLQNLLASKGFSPGTVDGSFGANTETAVRNFQSNRRLTVDGICGPNTKTALYTDVDIRTSSCPSLIQRGQTGQCVTSLQHLLAAKGFSPGAADGDFGPATETAVRSFQSSRGLSVDGIAGPNTKNALYAAGGPAPTAPAPTGPAPTAPAPTAPAPAPTSGPTCTATEFANAVASNGYSAQPDSKRTTMLASIQRLGGTAVISTKRELAMWLAQVFHESIGLSTKSEIGGSSASYAPYYGRGYIQLTGKSNYAAASNALFNDDRLVSNPDQVATDDNISWDVSTNYWKTRVHNLSGVSAGQFGATTRGINGGECTANPERAQARCNIYKKVLVAFNINEVADCSGCT